MLNLFKIINSFQFDFKLIFCCHTSDNYYLHLQKKKLFELFFKDNVFKIS